MPSVGRLVHMKPEPMVSNEHWRQVHIFLVVLIVVIHIVIAGNPSCGSPSFDIDTLPSCWMKCSAINVEYPFQPFHTRRAGPRPGRCPIGSSSLRETLSRRKVLLAALYLWTDSVGLSEPD